MNEFRKEEQEQEEKENKILNFLDFYGEDIVKIFCYTILLAVMFFTANFILDKKRTVETKEEYTTATVVGFDEKSHRDIDYYANGIYRSKYYRNYYIDLDINGNVIREENEKLYMTSNIGDVYKIKLVGNFNKYDELIDYNIVFIEKVEEN